MSSLAKDLRNELSRTVLAARPLAEAAAVKALHTLGVDDADPPGHLDTDGRRLRVRLRAQARQLGDREDARQKGCYEIRHLAEKIAYDHWHRLLFARFLAENDLLISPDHGVGVSLADCEELAPALGLRDGWEVAARFAARMLPQIFRADDPAGNVTFAPEDRTALRKLVTGLPREILLADDSLGWCYQFWQAQRKEEVNRSGGKIGADEISPVTQLFTEDYMVLFLLHNTLGAWWAGRQLAVGSGQLAVAKTEDECRQAVALPGVEWKYLRFLKVARPSRSGLPDTPAGPDRDGLATTRGPDRDGLATFTPAAGTFDGWPKTAKELRVLDPCMGSGHFLVFELPILVAMRMVEEGLSREEAVKAVLRDNIFGLELDPRCTQIAAFNLALAAWKLAGDHIPLPPLNLACCGLGINASKSDWTELADRASDASPMPSDRTLFSTDESLYSHRLRSGMERLYDLFKQAPVLGSLIQPNGLSGDLVQADFRELLPLLKTALETEDARRDPQALEMTVTAQGLAHAAEILAGKFTLVATNVPYLGRGKQDDVLKSHLDNIYPESKWDLATAIVERCMTLCAQSGTSALVTPSQWCSGDKYISFRDHQIQRTTWNVVARLGTNAFETISGEVVNVILVVLSREQPDLDRVTNTLDLCGFTFPSEKKTGILSAALQSFNQLSQIANPDKRITFRNPSSQKLLATFAKSTEGLSAGDGERFILKFWENSSGDSRWEFLQSAPEKTILYCGLTDIVLWEDGSGEMARSEAARIRGHSAWGKPGIVVAKMNSIRASAYLGGLFAKNCVVLTTQTPEACPALLEFVSSAVFDEEIQRLDGNLNTATSVFEKVPFDLTHWQKIAAEKYPDGLPKPHSDDPTQWLFDGVPRVAGASSSGTTSDGGRRPEQDAPATLQIAVARLLGYRWPRQTGSEFPDCPALGPDGLEPFTDPDGIVCISAIHGERPAAERLRALLAAANVAGVSSSGDPPNPEQNAPATIPALLAAVGYAGKSLDDWLRNGFFEQHCQLFLQRPFIWHIWDGLRDGFSVLVNYHKLTRSMLEKLTYTYLGDWIGRQKAAVAAGEEGSDAKLAAAQQLQTALKLIIEGEAPYDIFVRWKPLEKQPIGWEPDLNDGVRLNIRPFLSVPAVGRKGAGILRWAPKIKWDKDRGKDVPSAPWFKLFHGDRINDHHLPLAEKRGARDEVARPSRSGYSSPVPERDALATFPDMTATDNVPILADRTGDMYIC